MGWCAIVGWKLVVINKEQLLVIWQFVMPVVVIKAMPVRMPSVRPVDVTKTVPVLNPIVMEVDVAREEQKIHNVMVGIVAGLVMREVVVKPEVAMQLLRFVPSGNTPRRMTHQRRRSQQPPTKVLLLRVVQEELCSLLSAWWLPPRLLMSSLRSKNVTFSTENLKSERSIESSTEIPRVIMVILCIEVNMCDIFLSNVYVNNVNIYG